MALSDSGGAIGAVANLLRDQLQSNFTDKKNRIKGFPDITVTVGKPKQNTSFSKPVLNLNIYEIQFDPSMKNTPCEGVGQPIWLVLKFLMTGYDTSGDSDSIDAYTTLSRGIQALEELNFLGLNRQDSYISALENNPEPLKITFDSISPDLLSKIIQGTNDIFRVSAGFQIRPVLIAPGDIASYPMLVGFDNTINKEIREEGIHIDLLTFRPHTIENVSPAKFGAKSGTKILLSGDNLDIPDLSVRLGSLELPVISQRSDQLACEITNIHLESISAGSHPISVIRKLPNGRRISSNVLNVDLIPVLESASFLKDTGNRIELKGTLLGGEDDDIIVVLSKNGTVFRLIETFKTDPKQKLLVVEIDLDEKKDLGTYRVTLRVNSQQAAHSPEVEIT